MNKLLVRVYLYLLFMVAFSLVHVGSIQQQIMTEGSFWGYQIIEKTDLHIFYQTLNEVLRTKFITDSRDYDSIMAEDVDTLEELYGIGTLLDLRAVYDENGMWASGSDTNVGMKNGLYLTSGKFEKYARMILPPEHIDDMLHIKSDTTDGKTLTFVVELGPRTAAILNAYSVSSYKLYVWSIIISIVVAFLPIGLFFYVNYIRPLDRLERAANAIARGQLDISINPRGLDEIKDFSKAFDNMRHELEESKKREQEVLENRQQLITNISHDLRTPITSISGYVEGLLDGKGKNPERMERYLRTIKSKTEYLNEMINDLFLFSQLDMNGYTLDSKLYNSRELLNMLMEPIELWLDDTDFKLYIDKPYPAVPIKADYIRLSQVVENIVQNSIKYANDDGHMHITSFIKDHHLVISFSDNGIGIKEEALPYVFEAFYRADQSRTQSLGGAGLGLSICKKIVDLHGGMLTISSEYGKGTKIDIYLPLEQYVVM